MPSILFNIPLAPVYRCSLGTVVDTSQSGAKWKRHQESWDHGAPNDPRCNWNKSRSYGWTQGKWKSWKFLVWPCCYYSHAERKDMSVTIALVLISKESVFKTKIKKWHSLFIKSYQFYLVFMVCVIYVLNLIKSTKIWLIFFGFISFYHPL